VTTFIVLLRFTEHRRKATELMAGHNAWIQQGFDDGAFVLSGGLQPGLGGVVLARAESRDVLEQRLARDPFVVERVVSVEILEVAVARVEPRLNFLR
jgi:uncharacterized protein YciI